MLARFLDWLLGKRYRSGWPRGVRPMAPIIARMREFDPDWSSQTLDWTVAGAFQAFADKHDLPWEPMMSAGDYERMVEGYISRGSPHS